jgi:hypothetical protein
MGCEPSKKFNSILMEDMIVDFGNFMVWQVVNLVKIKQHWDDDQLKQTHIFEGLHVAHQ